MIRPPGRLVKVKELQKPPVFLVKVVSEANRGIRRMCGALAVHSDIMSWKRLKAFNGSPEIQYPLLNKQLYKFMYNFFPNKEKSNRLMQHTLANVTLLLICLCQCERLPGPSCVAHQILANFATHDGG